MNLRRSILGRERYLFLRFVWKTGDFVNRPVIKNRRWTHLLIMAKNIMVFWAKQVTIQPKNCATLCSRGLRDKIINRGLEYRRRKQAQNMQKIDRPRRRRALTVRTVTEQQPSNRFNEENEDLSLAKYAAERTDAMKTEWKGTWQTSRRGYVRIFACKLYTLLSESFCCRARFVYYSVAMSVAHPGTVWTVWYWIENGSENNTLIHWTLQCITLLIVQLCTNVTTCFHSNAWMNVTWLQAQENL